MYKNKMLFWWHNYKIIFRVHMYETVYWVNKYETVYKENMFEFHTMKFLEVNKYKLRYSIMSKVVGMIDNGITVNREVIQDRKMSQL
jgi:hypothetical protein